MKQETTEAVIKSGAGIAGTATSWSLHDSNQVVALLVGVVTFVYIVVQLFFLLRKWYRLEKADWKVRHTDAAPFDEGKE